MVGADEKLRKLGNLLLVTFFFLLCKCQQLLGDRELQHVLSALRVDLNFSKGGGSSDKEHTGMVFNREVTRISSGYESEVLHEK